jgi:hypothetical protein
VNVRALILSGGLLLVLAGGALAEGEFQTTRNGKTMVWNSAPKPGDTATWNGDRDRDGYASGFGTLTWYAIQRSSTKPTVYGIYYGNMVHGKFEGPVNVHVKNKTAHGVFTDGVRTTRWAGGPAPSFKIAQKPSAPEPAPAKEEAVSRPVPKTELIPTAKPEVTPAPTPRMAKAKVEATPAATPPAVTQQHEETMAENPPAETAPIPAEKPAPSTSPAPSPRSVAKKPPVTNPKEKVKDKYDDSLRALVGPPRSLSKDSISKASAKAAATPVPEAPPNKPAVTAMATPRMADLAEEDVIELADAEALAQGYDLGNYLSPKLDFSKTKEKWTVFYDSKTGGANDGAGKSLVVSVEDKTKKASVTSHR